MDPAPPSSIPPKVLEPVGRHFGIPDRVLDVLVAEVVLQGPRVVAVIGQLEPTGMAKHVRVDREWHVSGFPEALDEAMEANGADWRAAHPAPSRKPRRKRGAGAKGSPYSATSRARANSSSVNRQSEEMSNRPLVHQKLRACTHKSPSRVRFRA